MHKISCLLTLDPENLGVEDPCLFWAEAPDKRFVRDIDRLGQVSPVLVMNDSGRNILVAGYKRTLALIKLKRRILALQVSMTDDYTKGLLYITSNHGHPVDQGMIVRALRYFASIDSITEEVWELLGVKSGSKDQTLWKTWLNLPLPWDRLLAQGSLSLECAPMLETISSTDLVTLFPFFSELSWSRNNSINFLTWLTEKSRMSNTDTTAIIDSLELENVLKSHLSPGDKIKKILNLLYQSRYPVLSGMKKNLEKRLDSATRESGWRIEHRDDFESREIIISTKIKNPNDLSNAITRLEKFASSGIFDNWPVK